MLTVTLNWRSRFMLLSIKSCALSLHAVQSIKVKVHKNEKYVARYCKHKKMLLISVFTYLLTARTVQNALYLRLHVSYYFCYCQHLILIIHSLQYTEWAKNGPFSKAYNTHIYGAYDDINCYFCCSTLSLNSCKEYLNVVICETPAPLHLSRQDAVAAPAAAPAAPRVRVRMLAHFIVRQ